LENVETALFILEDNQERGLEAHILVGHRVEGKIGYSCWAINIKEEGKPELDKTWIDGINRILDKPIITIEPPEGVSPSNWTPIREDWQPMVEKIAMWENSKEKINGTLPKYKYIARGNILIQMLHKLNLQARCVFSEERIQEIKENDKVVELVFKQADDFPISQWVEPEERYHIPTDEKGYRILENVKTAIFILEDNLDEGLEGHILVGHEIEGKMGYSCWAIQQEGSNELDKTWINEVKSTFKGGQINWRGYVNSPLRFGAIALAQQRIKIGLRG
jgi:hypothetical protein